MAENAPEQRLGTPQKHVPTCDKHRGLIDVFCEDCDEFICTDCAKTDHENHNWATIVKAASQRRRQLVGFIQTIKEEKVPEMDRNIEKVSIKMTEIEKQCDCEIQKLWNHVDEIIARLMEIKTRHENNLIHTATEQAEQVNRLKTKYQKRKKNIVDIVKLMEEHNSTMSDYKFINHHREISKLVSTGEVDVKIGEFSLRYTRRECQVDEIDSLMGHITDLEDINATETNSFQYTDNYVSILKALDENESNIKFLNSKYVEQVNKKGDKKHKYNVVAFDLCVTDTGDVYFTDYKNRTIGRLSPSGYVSTLVSTNQCIPIGICQSLEGGFLVTLSETTSDIYTLNSRNRRLVRHVSLTGDVIREYEYQQDGHTRLFTAPFRVQQNGTTDIYVVNRTSKLMGNVVILSSCGRLRSIYYGQNLNVDFCPFDLACDSHCNTIVTDVYNHRIHLLSPDGEFLKFLLTENEVYCPTALSVYGSTLWVGNVIGTVKLFQI